MRVSMIVTDLVFYTYILMKSGNTSPGPADYPVSGNGFEIQDIVALTGSFPAVPRLPWHVLW